MSLCSNCRRHAPITRVSSCVLCGRCAERAIHARRWTSRNIRALRGTPHSLAHRMFRLFVREQADQLHRKHAASPITPVPAGAVIARESFFTRMRSGLRHLPNLFRGFFQPGRA